LGFPQAKQAERRIACYCFEFQTGSAMMPDARYERVFCEILRGCPLIRRRLLLRGW
jgi:hypothetical protein